MKNSIWCSRPVVFQNKEQQDNKEYSINEIKIALFESKYDDDEDDYQDVEDYIKYLKTHRNPNIIQGKGESLSEAKSCWNNLYFIDSDFKQWTAGEDGMRQCIAEIQTAFPNHLMIKPSNRFGIHTILSSDSSYYSGQEHVFYAIMVHRIVSKYNPIYKDADDTIEKRVMDAHFFNNLTQRMNLNLYTFYEGRKYRTSDFAIFNENPTPYPFPSPTIEESYDNLSDEEKGVMDSFTKKMLVSKPYESDDTNLVGNIVYDGIKFNINKDFAIPGVPYTGNDLRWRIAAILYNKLGYDEAGMTIISRFIQKDEMLSALNTIYKTNHEKYAVSNYLLEQFVERKVLMQPKNKESIHLANGEYLSQHIDRIENEIKKGSVYLVSPPNTGKTELIKSLSKRLDKCIIIVHQHSILNSKYINDSIIKNDFAVVSSKDAKKIKTIPDKFICIWDAYVLIAKYHCLSGHYVLLDETHNFVTQFAFRKIIIDVLDNLKNEHQLWMTGTPCGEEILMPVHTLMNFTKNSTTHYTIRPIKVTTQSRNDYREYIAKLIEVERQRLKDGKNRKVFIYDNYNHNYWKHYFQDDCAQYVSIYKDTDDVKEINETNTTSKDIVSSTHYLGEGVDINEYKEVLVIIPTDRFVSELNIKQYIKRFREASNVEVILIQYVNSIDNPLPSVQGDLDRCQEYFDGFANGHEERNPQLDKWLKVDKLDASHLKKIVTENKYQNLYKEFFTYQSHPFNIYMAFYLASVEDNISVDEIEEVTVEKASAKFSSKIEPEILDYLSNNYLKIAYLIKTSGNYEEVIREMEKDMEITKPFPHRKELRDILKVIHAADALSCLVDCARRFVKGGGIQWKRIGAFVESIKTKKEWLNKRLTFDSSIYSIKVEGDKMKDTIDKYCNMLNFPICASKTFVDEVFSYRNEIANRRSTTEKSKDLFDKNQFISIFKPVYIPKNQKKKPIMLTNKDSGDTLNFDTISSCISFLGTSKPTFKELMKGRSKLSKHWSVSVA